MNNEIKYEIGDNQVGEWFVYDMDTCYCCAGPMSQDAAITKKEELESQANEQL